MEKQLFFDADGSEAAAFNLGLTILGGTTTGVD
jgi:hypothetical protein